MKTRYLVIICGLGMVVNALSIYNYLLAICSLFLLLIVLIPRLIMKLTSAGKKSDNWKHAFVTSYGNFETSKKLNRLAIIFSVIIVNILAVILLILTVLKVTTTRSFISEHIPWEGWTPILGVIGILLFVLSLLLVTRDAVGLLRNEKLFNKKTPIQIDV